MTRGVVAGGLSLAAIAAVAGAASVALLAGGGQPAQAAVRRAAARTLQAGSSRFTITAEQPGLAAFGPHVELEGIMDYVHHRGSTRYTGPFPFDNEQVFDGDTTYMKLGPFAPWLPRGRPWLRLDGDEPDPFDPQERALRDPSTLLRFLRLTSSEVREVGREKVRGAEATHYEGTLDLERVVGQAPERERALLQEELDFLREDMPTKIAYGIWADDSGLTRRLRIDDAAGGNVTIDFFDYGVPVHVQAPPGSQVIGMDEFARLIEEHAGDNAECEGAESEGSRSSTEENELSTGGSSVCVGLIKVAGPESGD